MESSLVGVAWQRDDSVFGQAGPVFEWAGPVFGVFGVSVVRDGAALTAFGVWADLQSDERDEG